MTLVPYDSCILAAAHCAVTASSECVLCPMQGGHRSIRREPYVHLERRYE
jgi:hypothetical protein